MTTNFQPISNNPRNSFTLIELLVVLALVAILSIVVVMTLNPAELIKQARDSNRLSDLSTINTALNLFSADVTSGFMGTSTIVYISLPDNASSTCGSLGLPTLPAGYTYNCVSTANLRNTNGTGWIPVNFQRISSNSPISQLPIDPINTTSSGNYYAYVTGGSWMLTAIPESQKQKLELSSNPHLLKYPSIIGIGNNLDISPLYNPNGLIGYWKFDEGGGTVANDSVGSTYNGTWYGNGSKYATGKVGHYGGQFNGTDDYVDVGVVPVLAGATTTTLTGWVYRSSQSDSVAFGNYANYNRFGVAWSTNKVYVLAESGLPSYPNFVTSDAIGWHYCSLVFRGANPTNKVTAYWDGIEKSLTAGGNPTPSALSTSSIAFRIGYLGDVGFSKGNIDDVRIYNRALSAAEILGLYNATK